MAAGLSPKSAEATEAGLPNTIFAVVILHAVQIVGMGRIVGDSDLFYQILDIAIHPEHQGRGLGKAVVGALVNHLRRTAPRGAFVSLIADGEAHRLYVQFGSRTTAPASVGMALPSSRRATAGSRTLASYLIGFFVPLDAEL